MVTVNGPQSISLTWREPEQADDNIFIYTVTIISNKTGVINAMSTPYTNVTVNGLSPFTTYAFEVSASSGIIRGVADLVFARTAEGGKLNLLHYHK